MVHSKKHFHVIIILFIVALILVVVFVVVGLTNKPTESTGQNDIERSYMYWKNVSPFSIEEAYLNTQNVS
ncbi:MAG: hypothetical protein AB1391_01560 [Candidatus Micrarchaeota archaeon]